MDNLSAAIDTSPRVDKETHDTGRLNRVEELRPALTGVAALCRNRWQDYAGMGGSFAPESVAGLGRNTHELRRLIRRMARDNPLWGQVRIMGELWKLGYAVSPRTVRRYMRRPWSGKPSPRWKDFLRQHAKDIWACDFLTVRTLTFQTLYVFFLIHHASREIVHIRVTRHPTALWTGQQLVNACFERAAAPVSDPRPGQPLRG